MNFEEFIESLVMRGNDYARNDPLELFHPSSAGFCKRQMFLAKTNNLKFSKKSMGSMLSGTIFHHWLESEVKTHKKNIETEKQNLFLNVPNSPIYFKGKCDYYDSENNVVYELKTMSSLNEVLVSPFERHIDQVMVYIESLKAQYCDIIYLNKNDLSTKMHRIHRSELRIESIFSKVIDVYNMLKESKANPKFKLEACSCEQCARDKLFLH